MLTHSVLTMSRGDAPRLREWVEYHAWLGFDDFHIILDNPIDDSERVLRSLDVPAKITVQVMPAYDEYYDGLDAAERWEKVRAWRDSNADRIADMGMPIIDPLSMRQYLYLPAVMNKYAVKGEGWLSIIDVDEFIALPGGKKITDLTAEATQPRVRFLNFNFDTTGSDPARPVLQQHTQRWSRDDVVSHGGGWENRVKSIARYGSLFPLRSVHAISSGPFEILDPEVGRLHHYKPTDQGLPIPYSVEDTTLVNSLPEARSPYVASTEPAGTEGVELESKLLELTAEYCTAKDSAGTLSAMGLTPARTTDEIASEYGQTLRRLLA